MKKILFITLLFLAFGVSSASAAEIALFDWAFKVDATTYEKGNGDLMPTTGSLIQGLGTLTWSTNVAGSHSFFAFFDHEIDEGINTYFNEYGEPHGTPVIGQSWEIDEPGYVFGDIYDNVLAGSLDNTGSVPTTYPDDVSMAMGWDFTLLAGESATILLRLGSTAPSSGFYLAQTDPDSQEIIYLSSTLRSGGTPPVPEPATMLLLGTGLAGLFGFGRKRFTK